MAWEEKSQYLRTEVLVLQAQLQRVSAYSSRVSCQDQVRVQSTVTSSGV